MTRTSARTVLAAPDKFRGSLTAPQVVAAVRAGAGAVGWHCIGQPLADGGEGMVDAFGGANRRSRVTGPLGTAVEAAWRLGEDGTAVIESAAASGLAVAGGAERNDPMTTTTTGTGELVAEAVEAGAGRVLVGLGGSATTDGGLGAVEAVLTRLGGPVPPAVELLVACDVETVFADAARVFGPQKGASPQQVTELTGRLERLAQEYADRFGTDLRDLPGAGAAGGLGGGLVVLGGRLVPGFDLVAGQVGLADLVAGADLVVTGEGALDAESFHGKVVGGVVETARAHGIPVLVLAGTVRPDSPTVGRTDPAVTVVDLSASYGAEESWERTADCVQRATRTHLAGVAR